MSSYEDYTQTSENYDKTREPVGTEISVGCFAHGPVPLDQMVVLDAGCGTGNYAQAMLHYVGQIEAVDLNLGMLEVASQKLSGPQAEGRISFHSARIDELPFEDETFDGVMINQVLHHLPDDATKGFPIHRNVFSEFARVLKTGGVLVVNTCSQEPLRPPRRAGRDPRRLRLRIPGKVRAARCHGPGRTLLRPSRPTRQRVAGRRLGVVAGLGRATGTGLLTDTGARRTGRARSLPGAQRCPAPRHRPGDDPLRVPKVGAPPLRSALREFTRS
jgi:SAM-dependent methyltransferase